MEACTEKRRRYQEEIANIPSEKLVYIDESGIELTIRKDRGWSAKGSPISAKKSGKYYERTNIIAGLVSNKSIAPMVFNGSCTTDLFNSWVEKLLIKELKPGQFVVMDNAAFHKSQKTKELITKALKKHKGRRKDAADELGISERTLYRKIKEYDIAI